jgi:ABC-type branched-subunit amino acid transport system ATPase component
MEAIIEVNSLRKPFGPTVVLGGITFTVLPGQVTRFIGPNGARRPPVLTCTPYPSVTPVTPAIPGKG